MRTGEDLPKIDGTDLQKTAVCFHSTTKFRVFLWRQLVQPSRAKPTTLPTTSFLTAAFSSTASCDKHRKFLARDDVSVGLNKPQVRSQR